MGNTLERNRAGLLNSATLDDLIRDLTALRDRRPDLAAEPVLLAYDYGDYCHTTALGPIQEARFVEVEESCYSNSGLAVRTADEDEEEEPPRRVTDHAIVLGIGRSDYSAQDLETTSAEVVL